MENEKQKESYAEPLAIKHDALKKLTGNSKQYHEVPGKDFEDS